MLKTNEVLIIAEIFLVKLGDHRLVSGKLFNFEFDGFHLIWVFKRFFKFINPVFLDRGVRSPCAEQTILD